VAFCPICATVAALGELACVAAGVLCRLRLDAGLNEPCAERLDLVAHRRPDVEGFEEPDELRYDGEQEVDDDGRGAGEDDRGVE